MTQQKANTYAKPTAKTDKQHLWMSVYTDFEQTHACDTTFFIPRVLLRSQAALFLRTVPEYTSVPCPPGPEANTRESNKKAATGALTNHFSQKYQ